MLSHLHRRSLILNESQCCLPLISVPVGCIGCVRAAPFSQQSGVARRQRATRAAQRTVARARRATLGGHHYFVGEMLTTPSQDSPGVGECFRSNASTALKARCGPILGTAYVGSQCWDPPAVAPLSLGVVLVQPPPRGTMHTHWNIGRSLPQLNRPPGRSVVVCSNSVNAVSVFHLPYTTNDVHRCSLVFSAAMMDH